MLQVVRSSKVYDVCIVGSGVAGGAAAKVMAEGGLDLVMLEAGPMLDMERDFKEHLSPYQLPHRGAGIGGSGYDTSGSAELGVAHISTHVKGEPYTSAPDSPFIWLRARLLGGRTNHWTRVALRMAPADFKPRSSLMRAMIGPFIMRILPLTAARSSPILASKEPGRTFLVRLTAFSALWSAVILYVAIHEPW